MPLPKTETFYVWKELVAFDNEDDRLLTPHSDPMEYEYPIDFMFESPEEAMKWVKECEMEEEARDWILCHEILKPIIHGSDCFMKKSDSMIGKIVIHGN